MRRSIYYDSLLPCGGGSKQRIQICICNPNEQRPPPKKTHTIINHYTTKKKVRRCIDDLCRHAATNFANHRRELRYVYTMD